MHPDISYELATSRIADLRRQAQRYALARGAAHVPSSTPQPHSNRILVSIRRVGRQHRSAAQLWTLLHAQALLSGPTTAAGSARLMEDSS